MGVHSKVWGQYLWRLLHALTYSYNQKMNTEMKAKYVRLFHVLKVRLKRSDHSPTSN